MQGQQNHSRPYYRCRFPDEYGVREAQHPRNLYVKESVVLRGLDRWLASLFDKHHLDETSEILSRASQPDPNEEARRATFTKKMVLRVELGWPFDSRSW